MGLRAVGGVTRRPRAGDLGVVRADRAAAAGGDQRSCRRRLLAGGCRLGAQKAVQLDSDAGVRLALATLAVLRMRCPRRRAAVLAGVEALGDEECLYWYAKARGSAGNRALRALRLLLTDG